MTLSVNRRLAAVSFIVVFFITISFAQDKDPIRTPCTIAVVTTAGNAEIQVEQFRLRESPGGQWINEKPKRIADELYYRIQKDGVTISKVISLEAIESIDFKTFVAEDAMYPEVREMLIKLRDGGTIEWIHSDTSVTITNTNGQKEKLKSFAWLSGVVSSGQKEQGNDYVITGFTGFTNVNGKRNEWEAVPVEIKRIRFIDSK